ncbi:MAG: hypothetical protein HOP10_14240 [Chitinophagaceae bacterium]|nr:hypothetical protein [Chitinophagaceae bacterium]
MKKFTILSIAILIMVSAQAQNCPGISVEPSSYEIPAGDTLTIVAVTKNTPASVTYNWTISNGTIISGQGTAMIKVNTAGLPEGAFITATLELGGIPKSCTNTASASSEVIPAAQLVTSGRFTEGQELKNAVQQFIAATAFKDPENAGLCFIYLYPGAKTTEASMKIFRQAIISAFEYNKILPHQYSIAEGGSKKLNHYEMYLVSERGGTPKPSN